MRLMPREMPGLRWPTTGFTLSNCHCTQEAYTLHAIPQLGQAADRLCGTLSLDSMGIKRATGGSATRECW